MIDVEKTGIARGYEYPMEEIKEEENEDDSVEISLSNATVSQGSVDFDSAHSDK